MHSFSEYLQQSNPEPQISAFFEKAGPAIAARLTLENLDFETQAIYEFENTLPDSFNFHLDMILTGGATMLSQYYQDLTSTKEAMFEGLRAKMEGEDFQKIQESLVSLRALIKTKYSKINEQVALDLDTKLGDITNDAVIDTALKGAPEGTKSKSQILSLLKELWNGLTDDGDWLSILQLVLDIVGIFDPTITVDSVNAIIYFARGRWLLGAISIVGALVPYAGDSLKLLKLGKTGKYAEEIVSYAIKGGRGAAEKALMRVPIKDRGIVSKVLAYLAKVLPSAMSKASAALSSFFGKYLAKYTKWIPGMEKFFNGLSKRFAGYAKTMDDLVKNLTFDAGTLIKSSAATSDLAAAVTKGAKMELDAASGMVKLYNAEGKVIREFSEEFLKKSKFWKQLGTNPIVRNVSTTESLIKYYNGIAKVSPSLFSTVSKIFSTIHKGVKGTAKFTLFVGKQIIKLATGKTADELGISDSQAEFYGADFLNNAVQKKIKEAKDAGAKYVPLVTFDAADSEDYQTITKYQNDWAKVVGGPEIIPVLYNQYGDPEMTKEYNDFWDKVESGEEGKPVTKFGNEDVMQKQKDFFSKIAKGKITRDESGNLIKGAPVTPEKAVQQVPNLKSTDWYQEAFPQAPNESLNILSFAKFIK